MLSNKLKILIALLLVSLTMLNEAESNVLCIQADGTTQIESSLDDLSCLEKASTQEHSTNSSIISNDEHCFDFSLDSNLINSSSDSFKVSTSVIASISPLSIIDTRETGSFNLNLYKYLSPKLSPHLNTIAVLI